MTLESSDGKRMEIPVTLHELVWRAWIGALLSRHLKERYRTTFGVRQCRNLIRNYQPSNARVTNRTAGLPATFACARPAAGDLERQVPGACQDP